MEEAISIDLLIVSHLSKIEVITKSSNCSYRNDALQPMKLSLDFKFKPFVKPPQKTKFVTTNIMEGLLSHKQKTRILDSQKRYLEHVLLIKHIQL